MPRIAIPIPPVKRPAPLAEQIVRQLLDMIRSGQLETGMQLPAERVLATKFGVGRPTLREALRALQLLGVLDIRHGGGVYVADMHADALLMPLKLFVSLDRQSTNAVLEARRVIEGALLAYAAPRLGDDTLARLDANLQELERLSRETTDQATTHRRFGELAQDFRGILAEVTDNPVLQCIAQMLDPLSTAIREQLQDPEVIPQVLNSHRLMLLALTQRDPTAAQRALNQHIDFLATHLNPPTGVTQP